MRDVGGWDLRLTSAQIAEYVDAGVWGSRTLADDALSLAEARPDLPLVWDGAAISAARVVGTARAVAGGLGRAGIRPGDVIALQMPNRWECLAINLAACLVGAVVTPIVPIYRERELTHMLGHGGAKVLFIPDVFRGTDYRQLALAVRSSATQLEHIVVLGNGNPDPPLISFDRFVSGDALRLHERWATDANAIKLLLYTSGTTGRPKGVLHTHNTLRAEINAVAEFWQLTATDVVLMPSPVTHITGYLYGLEMPFMLGCRVVLMDTWSAAQAVELVAKHGVTACIAATPFLAELVDEAERRGTPLPSVRLFACGGAPVPPDLVRRALTWLPGALTMRVYGSTEAPTIALGITREDDRRYAMETEGRIVGHEARLVDPQTGAAVAAGEEGEVATQGPELFVGYADPDDNRGAFLADGAFLTGDLGQLVARDFLKLTGRKKELIIRGGVNIAPKEIEDLLLLHPDIADIAVVGIPHHRLGETVCACIVPASGAPLSLGKLSEFLQGTGLAKQKWPQHIETMTALPRTAAGKVQKVAIKRELAQRLDPI